MRRSFLLFTQCAVVAAQPWRSLEPGAVYAGQYMCGSAAWLMLHFEQVNEQGVSAVFHFLYPGSTQHGAYVMTGKHEMSGRVLRFEPAEWLWQSQGKVVKVGLMGVISEDGSSISGEVMHLSCGRFQVNRTTLDVTPPEMTVPLGRSDYGPTHRMVLKAEGSLVAAAEPGADGGSSAEAAAARSKRAHLQMLLNGVRGLVEEARSERREAQKAAAEAAQARAPPEPSTAEGSPQGFAAAAASATGRDGAQAAKLAAELEVHLRAGEYATAYALWAARGREESVQRGAARIVLAANLRQRARVMMAGGDGGQTSEAGPSQERATARATARAQQRQVMSTLAVFGGGLPAAGRALSAVLSAEGEEVADYLFAEEQLSLALNRSGCREADAMLGVAEGQVRDGAGAVAAATLQQLHTRVRPQWAYPLRRHAAVARELGRQAEAIGLLRSATRLAAHDVFAWVDLGHVLKQTGDTKGALAAYKQAQRRYPTMPDLRRLRQWITAVEQFHEG